MTGRRAFPLLGAIAVAVVALGGCGDSPQVQSGSADAKGASILRYSIDSKYVHQAMPQTAIAAAGGGAGRPLLVFLHGKGNTSESNANPAFLAALATQGKLAPDVVFPSGNDHSYWHNRQSGDWTKYVLDEVIPAAIRRLNADPKRIAIGGISMGGFGAFNIARARPAEFCAVGGHSAALWQSAGDTAPGAFDNAEDFDSHDVLGLARSSGRAPWGDAKLWLDGGTDDPFKSAGEEFAAALGIPMNHWPGGHTGSYWQAHFRDYLNFYSRSLAACRP